MEDLGFTKLAEYYGIPSFSWRDFLCPLTSTGKREKMRLEPNMFSTAGRIHVGFKAHAQIASMAIDYFNRSLSQYNLSKSEPFLTNKSYLTSPVKPLFIDSSISDFQLDNSLCLSYLTPNWEVPVKQTLAATVIESDGFYFVQKKKSIRQYVPDGADVRTDASAGWLSKARNSLLKIQFVIPSTASMNATTSYRSVAVNFHMVPSTTSIEIWLNEDRMSSVIIGKDRKCKTTRLVNRLYPIATKISPGNYTINIASKIGGKVLLSGLVIGYPGYHGYEGYVPIDVKYRVWSQKDYEKWRC
jgi:hypothetical protein